MSPPCTECCRRRFTNAGLTALSLAGVGTAVFGVEFLSPNVLFEPSQIIEAGRPDRFPPNSVTQDPVNGIYIVRTPKGIHTLSSVCTHLGCVTAWRPELGLIACPCHGSKFHIDGVKIEGPAPLPLPWLKTWLSREGILMIDKSEILPGPAFVKVQT